jgi:hypothetical protein
MPGQQGFHPFHFVFLQMKDENVPFRIIVQRLKSVPENILLEWNRKFEIEPTPIDPRIYLYIQLSPEQENVCRFQPYHFENTLDALRYELDELLNEKSQEMVFNTESADDEAFLIMLEETNSFCHRYLTDISITHLGANNYWVSFTLSEDQEKAVKRAKKAIRFYMKRVYNRNKIVEFSWN